MGKSPIPKTDYVMYFIRWFMVGHFNRGFYCIISIYPCVISVEAYRGGQTISKRTLHSLDREDHQDFLIRCRTYSNSIRDLNIMP